MIQPLKTARTTWTLFWVDLDEPLPSGKDFILPTLAIVTDSSGVPVAPPEILEELDQARIESLLGSLFDRVGAPDKLVIGEDEEWDHEAWEAFANDFGVRVQFTKFSRRNADDVRILTQHLAEANSLAEAHCAPSRDVAAGLVNTALRMRSESKKLALLKKAIDHDADCSRARVELGDAAFRLGNWKASLEAYDEVISRESLRWGTRRLAWWSDHETRPYLRAVYGRAMALWHQGKHLDSADSLAELLEINPRDHQGARFLLPLIHMLGEDFESARLCYEHYEHSYPNDYGEPSFLFGWGLLNAHFSNERAAKERYRLGMLKNLYIAPMLLDIEPPSEAMWHPNDRAEPGYARDFIESYAILWDRLPSALRLLREAFNELQPVLEKIVELRLRMFDFQDQRYETDYRQQWQELVAMDEKLTSG